MSAIQVARRDAGVAGLDPRAKPNAWWGTLLLVATEATLFLVLIASYFYLRFQSTPEGWPPGPHDPKLLKPIVMTLLLTGSSVPMLFAERGIAAGNRARLE